MEGDVIDFEFRIVDVMRGEEKAGERLQVRKKTVTWESTGQRAHEWGEWEDVGRAVLQLMSPAELARQKAEKE